MMAADIERNWALLPSELVGLIVDKVQLLPDFIRFGAVCKPWLSVMLDKHETRSQNCCKEPPMLWYPSSCLKWKNDWSFDERYLYSISERKAYTHMFCLPNSYNRHCRYKSSFGWSFIFHDPVSIELFNPFSKESIILPSLRDLEVHDNDFKVTMVVLSCDPSLHPNDLVVAAIGASVNGVYLTSSGNHLSWRTYYDNRINSSIVDICFYKGGLLFVLDYHRQLFVINYSSEHPSCCNANGWITISANDENGDIKDIGAGTVKIKSLISNVHSFIFYLKCKEMYLVVMEGDLLMVIGHFIECRAKNNPVQKKKLKMAFKVFRCSHKLEKITSDEMDADSGDWIEINDLGKYSLFVGRNQSMCISATDFPNCKPNCIYYTAPNQHLVMRDNIGVFDLNHPLEDENFDYHIFLLNFDSVSDSNIAPVWISPTLVTSNIKSIIGPG